MKRLRLVISISLVFILAVGVTVPLLTSSPAFAAETGDYPWATAELVNSTSYDWGYRECQPQMVVAGTCAIHSTTKNGVTYYLSDPWKYDVRNCTSFVAWRLHKDIGVQIDGWGNATDWLAAAKKAGYVADSAPQVGDIAYWSGGYGHVAYVVAVNADASVTVEQYNKAGTGEFSRQARVRAQQYIHVIAPRPAPEPIKTTNTSTATPKAVSATKQLPELAPNPHPVPHPQVTSLGPLPPTDTEEYDIVKEPSTGHIVVYQIAYSKTNSGYVELSLSNYADGNATWLKTWAVDQLMHTAGESSYKLADHNADKVLDLYQIKYARTTSMQTEVRVFDGASNYAVLLGTWGTSQSVHEQVASSFVVADHNGDGKLDVYTLSIENNQQHMAILDGAKGFSQNIADWHTEEQADAKPYFVVGDDDRDGIMDIYRPLHAANQEWPELAVYSASNHYKKPRYMYDPQKVYETSQ